MKPPTFEVGGQSPPVIFDIKIFENQSMKAKNKQRKKKKNLHFRHEFQVKFCYNLVNNSSFNPFSSLEFPLTKDLLV